MGKDYWWWVLEKFPFNVVNSKAVKFLLCCIVNDFNFNEPVILTAHICSLEWVYQVYHDT